MYVLLVVICSISVNRNLHIKELKKKNGKECKKSPTSVNGIT